MTLRFEPESAVLIAILICIFTVLSIAVWLYTFLNCDVAVGLFYLIVVGDVDTEQIRVHAS